MIVTNNKSLILDYLVAMLLTHYCVLFQLSFTVHTPLSLSYAVYALEADPLFSPLLYCSYLKKSIKIDKTRTGCMFSIFFIFDKLR